MNGNIWATILPLVILIAVMYFLLIRPQKKREKEVNAMRSGHHDRRYLRQGRKNEGRIPGNSGWC